MTDLDPVIHVPARLRIMATLDALDAGGWITFPRIQSLLNLTGGNLAVHLRKLEESGYVTLERSGGGRNASTKVSITPRGRGALADYRDALAEILGG